MKKKFSKIMITGISGLLGSNLAFYLAKNYSDVEIVGNYYSHPFKVPYARSFKINLKNMSKFERVFKKENPDTLIHTAAKTNVDLCEKNLKQTFNINSIVPGNLAKLAMQNDTKFVFISSDMVYGSNLSPHEEEEPPNSMNIYTESKIQAERIVKGQNPDSFIVRTNFFGWNYQNKESFAEWIINSLQNKIRITLFYDVIVSPLYVSYLSHILDIGSQKDLKGTYNIGCSNSISKLNFGLYLCKVLRLDSNYIIPISIDEKKSLVSRPKQMDLAVKKIETALNTKMPAIEDQIELMLKDLEENQPEKLRGL